MSLSLKQNKILTFLIFLLVTGILFSGCGHREPAAKAKDSPAAGGSSQESESVKPQEEKKYNSKDGDSASDNSFADTAAGSSSADSSAADKPAPDMSAAVPVSAAGSVPASDGNEDADNSYFADAVFIGDSLTEGFQLHGGITNATYYGFKNLNVKDVFTKPLVRTDSGKLSVADALKKQSFGKYYIMLGANELGWVYPEIFIEKYGDLIDTIRQTNSEAVIYLQSVLPVTAEVSATNQYYSNDRINYYDELISALAADKGVTYLNVREAVENSDKILPDEAATDGVHLKKDYCLKWADYLRSHT